MESSNLTIPENACAYEEYDPSSLKPANNSTCIRLKELDWTSDAFQGKTVLDIGCNSGILSLYANKLGASSIQSVDVQTPLVEFFTSVVQNHQLNNISVDQIGFNELNTDSHSADIVLCMEVLHWLVDQDHNVDNAIFKLASLTGETLYLETPWDIKEPSIALRGKVQHEHYNMELIVKELNKYFEDVQLVRFMTYFGKMKDSKRILIKASGKRANYESMRHLANTNSLNVSLTRGNNAIQLVTTPDGPSVIKKLPKEAMLPLLSRDIQHALFDTLNQANGPLLSARKIGDEYIVQNNDEESLMLFPFVGKMSDHFPEHKHHAPVPSPLTLAVECRRNLAQLPDKVVQAIKEYSPPISLKPKEELGEHFLSLINEKGLNEFLDNVYLANETDNRHVEDSVVHNDLQLGNMIADSSGKEWIIDLDIMRSGTAYSDFICCAIYNNCAEDEIIRLYEEMVKINQRPMQPFDMYFSMNILLRWIYELNRNHQHALKDLAGPAVNGMHTLHKIMSEQKASTVSADDLRKRLDYSFADYSFIQHCLDNTRAVHTETDDTSALLFFAMTAIGRFTKGSPAVQDFTNLFKELGREECATIVETCSYREQDLAYYWSSTKDLSSLFEPSSIKPIKSYDTDAQNRPLGDTIMQEEWEGYAYHEIDKIPDTIQKRSWHLYDLTDATIVYDTAEFAVLDSTGKPVLDLSSENYQHVYFTPMFRQYMESLDSQQTEPEHSVKLDSALMIQDLIRQPNFCHWLLDQLPRLRHLEDSQRIIMYIMAPWMKNMLELMGIDSNRVHEMKERAILNVGQLKIDSSMAKHFFHPCQDMNEELIQFVKKAMSSDPNASAGAGQHKHVYLSRNKFDRRRISNENELLNTLEQYDFHTVYPEELSMPEQIELFRHAEVIVSPHGASLANLVFCENTTLIEIFNQNYGTPTFYIMSKLLGFPYQHILGNNPLLSTAEQQRIGLAELQKEDMEVNIEKLEACLEKVFSGAEHADVRKAS